MLRLLTWSEKRLNEKAPTQREIRFMISGASDDVAAAAAAICRSGELILAKEMVALAERHGWAARLEACGGVSFHSPDADGTQRAHVHFEHVDWPTLLSNFARPKKAKRKGAGGAGEASKFGGADDYQSWDEFALRDGKVEDGHMRAFEALGLDSELSDADRGEAILSSLGGMGAALAEEGYQ